jgi:hypothetical protein
MAAHDTLTPARAKKTLEAHGIDLPERQFEMLYHYVSGDDKATACRKAGYPATASWTLFNRGKVRRALPLIIESFLVTDAAPAALRALYRIVTDDKAPGGVQVQAANSLLDRAGFGAKRHEKQAGEGKDVAQMSADELRQAIDKLQAEIDGRMHDVTPDSEPDDSQLAEIYP